MYKQYFKQAWNLMRQNRFYSGVYIIGTGLAISMVMVIAIVYHIRTADITPEVHRGKYLYIDQMKYERGKGNSNFFWGVRSAKECLMPLKSAKEVALMTNTATVPLKMAVWAAAELVVASQVISLIWATFSEIYLVVALAIYSAVVHQEDAETMLHSRVQIQE